MNVGKVNKAWHEAHVMPRNPTREERVEWHAGHAEACACRPVPESLAAEVSAFRGRPPARPN